MAIKTITLTGTEIAVRGIDGSNAYIRNDGTDVIYAAKTAGITAGADGVLSVPAGQSGTLRGISETIFLLGNGSVFIQSDDYTTNPFKTSTASGGSAVDETARTAISTHSGNTDIHVTAAEKSSWNSKAELSDIPSSLPADGGNSDMVDGKHANDFSQNKVLTTLDQVNDTNLESGIYSVEGLPIVYPYGGDSGTSNSYTMLIVNRFREGGSCGTQIAVPYEWGVMVGLYYRLSLNGVWSSWRNIADNGDAAMLETHPASDFVLKADYDALAARVAALESS